MGLNLGHHDLNPLLGHQGQLMFSDKLRVQPDVVEQRGRDHGDGQKREAGQQEIVSGIENDGHCYDEQVKKRQEHVTAVYLPVAPEGQMEEMGQTDGAYNVTGVAQGAANKAIFQVVGDAETGEEACEIEKGIGRNQKQEEPAFTLLTDDTDEEIDNQRLDTVAVNGDREPERRPDSEERELIIQIVLNKQTEDERKDDEHDAAMMFPEVGVGKNGKTCAQKLQQQGRCHQNFIDSDFSHPGFLLPAYERLLLWQTAGV